MAITNPQAVDFTNEQARVLANALAEVYRLSKQVAQFWFANAVSSVIPNDANETVVDGAEVDGRPIATGARVTNVVTRALDLIADYEANSNAKLNTVLQLSNR